MKTRTISLSIYSFAELDRKAKDRVIERTKTVLGYTWSKEAIASIEALAEHFGGKVKDYEIHWWSAARSSMDFEMPDGFAYEPGEDAATEAAALAAKVAALGTYNPETLKGNGDCVLTGYCSDENAIDGLRAAYVAGERDLDKLMRAAFKTWMAACEADYEAFYEDDTFAEHCESNEMEFLADGKPAPRE